MIYLFDTDMFVFMLRGLKITAARDERQRRWQAMGRHIIATAEKKEQGGHEVALSAITVAELEFGARHGADYTREMEATQRAMSPFTLCDFDATDCAFHYGAVRFALEGAGQAIGLLDTLIAAHALALEATLVTNNTAEFARVSGLKCENWTA
ncbi:MAG: PIN domain-containing protein [Verrucomicrobia bacterium]|nr:PIN domain-containing protein [Verrucomicrobiota bacterium]